MPAVAEPIRDPRVLVRLVEAVGERAIVAEEAEQFLVDPAVVAIGGYCDGKPAGYLIGYLVTRLDGARMLIVYDLAVATAARRRGVGRRMIGAALGVARRAGAAKAWVVTDDANASALALYRSTGAVDSGDDDRVLWWKLG
jgi:ribosomal protein S18 acetylase RimI-like enzyme